MITNGDEVSTGSGSDRVIFAAISTIAWIETRSGLPGEQPGRYRSRY
jgi:hypothetical protein